VTTVKKAAESGSWPLAADQATVRQQLTAMLDGLRQLIGSANIAGGSVELNDPLNAPFQLYVNPYIGSDAFAAGSFASYDPDPAGSNPTTANIDAKIRRIDNQRLTCGYSEMRPFKTINRAFIEAALITSKNWFTYAGQVAHLDCVSIRLSAGVHTLYNDPGNTGTTPTVWADGKVPTINELIAFNPDEGGVIMPRGCTVWAPDYRKCTIRPNYVPADADEGYSESSGVATITGRSCLFRTTGTGYTFGYTMMDKLESTASHHLLSGYEFASQAQLTAFYSKVNTALAPNGNGSAALLVARTSEHQIVGPISGNPSESWDTTGSASFYILNVGIRSERGLCGALMDGSKVSGLRSMVTAQFTNTNNQRTLSCWQIYAGETWSTPATYQALIDASPDSRRMRPGRRSFHIRVINGAFVQSVSVFSIGTGIHNWVQTGGELDATNGNTTFGGVAALAEGYRTSAFTIDKNWTIAAFKVPLRPDAKTPAIRRIFLGTVSSSTSSSITMAAALDPAVLESYTLRAGSYVWVENPQGPDWRAQLANPASSSATPTVINITAALADESAVAAGSNAVGRRIYIRRLADNRNRDDRRLVLQLNNTTNSRTPQRHQIIQLDPSRAGVNGVLPAATALAITSTIATTPVGAGVLRSALISLRRSNPSQTYSNTTYYRKGTVVKFGNKHFAATNDLISASATPDPALWSESFVAMPEAYNAEDPFANEAPSLILDDDASGVESSTTLGWDWSTAFTSASTTSAEWLRTQYRSGVDYQAAHALLVALGLSSTNAHAALAPQLESSRLRNPASSTDFPVAPAGGLATGRANYPVEFRRPSTLAMAPHRTAWCGWGNYSTALPSVQQDMAPRNRFSYLFTNSNGGFVACDGTQEDMLRFTPAGLEDLTTGEVAQVGDLGAPDVSVGSSTTFTGTIIDSLFQGVMDFTGATLQGFPLANSSTPGLIETATIAEVLTSMTTAGTSGLAVTTDSMPAAMRSNAVDLGNGTTIDLSLAAFFYRTINGNVTFTFTNTPANGITLFLFEFTYTSGTITWPAILWADGTSPTLVGGYTYTVAFYTRNGGSTWRGSRPTIWT
jgi:hypothetical protein